MLAFRFLLAQLIFALSAVVQADGILDTAPSAPVYLKLSEQGDQVSFILNKNNGLSNKPQVVDGLMLGGIIDFNSKDAASVANNEGYAFLYQKLDNAPIWCSQMTTLAALPSLNDCGNWQSEQPSSKPGAGLVFGGFGQSLMVKVEKNQWDISPEVAYYIVPNAGESLPLGNESITFQLRPFKSVELTGQYMRSSPLSLSLSDPLEQSLIRISVNQGSFSGALSAKKIQGQFNQKHTVDLNAVEIGFSWRTPWQGELSFGAESLLDPSASSSGRVAIEKTNTPYVRYKQDL